MPRYIDRHDLTDQVTAEGVAAAHLKDLEVQDWLSCGEQSLPRLDELLHLYELRWHPDHPLP